MARWISSRALEVAATGAVLVAAVTVILRGGHVPNNGDGWSAIDPVQIAIGASPGLGDNQATHAVMVFSDFECSFCRVAADRLIPWLRSEYGRGQLRLCSNTFRSISCTRTPVVWRSWRRVRPCGTIRGTFATMQDIVNIAGDHRVAFQS